MAEDLKKIVAKANKDHHLEMRQEQQILNNLGQSEEWFLNTYERLKKIAGKSLNDVDFKDYTQLSTVIHQEKDVDTLLKVSKVPTDQLVAAAYNLWKSLSGVKWLLELRKLIASSHTQEVEMKKVQDLDKRAQELGINYEEEIAKENVYESHFKEFSKLVGSISLFQSKFGDKKKLAKTLEEKYELACKKGDQDQKVFDDFQEEIKELIANLQNHKITSQYGELELLTKLHTQIEFLREYKKLADRFQNKLPFDQAMLLSQQARDQGLPDEISVLRELSERVNRFEKFNREYHDYKRFRERIKKQGYSLNAGILDVRFTQTFLKKLIEESRNLQIEKDDADDFDELLLQNDLVSYDQWRNKADELLLSLEEDENSLFNPDIRSQFVALKNQMRQLSVYDRDLFMKVQVFDWLFSCLDLLEAKSTDQEPESIGAWETKLKQADQYLGILKDLKSHSIYQRLIWENDQAKQVIDFVNQQKTNQKALAAKFNLDKQQNYAFFRNKHPKSKLQKMLDVARQSKVDLLEEVRCLDQWIRDFEKYTQQFKDGKLFTDYQFDKLKDITKQMYLSPIDYGEIYFGLKEKMDTAEMIKLNLKKIFQEHEILAQLKPQRPRRLKYSRISYDLRLYKKSCRIKGVKEIDLALEKVQASRSKLAEIKEIIAQVKNNDKESRLTDLRQKIENVKQILNEVEIDMEHEEIEVRRQIFETELNLIFNYQGDDKVQKLQYEEFKEYDKEYEKLRNQMKDEAIHAQFIEIRNKVNEIVRKINKLDTKQELQEILQKVENECPMIDFNQMLTDKDAKLLLGKRKQREQDRNSQQQDESEDDESATKREAELSINTNVIIGGNKRQKVGSQDSNLSQSVEIASNKELSDQEVSHSASDSSSSGSDSSSSSGSDSDDSGSENDSDSRGSKSGSQSSEGSSSDEDDSKDKKINIAKNRSRRNIIPNLNSDYIYEKPALKTVQKMQENRQKQHAEEKNESENEAKEEQEKESKDNENKVGGDVENESSKTSDSEEEKKKKKQLKKLKKLKKQKKREKRRIEKEKKKQMEKQLREYRLQHQKTQQTIQSRQKLQNKFEQEQPISFSTQVAHDKGLQDQLLLMKNRIREQSRQKIKETINTTPPVFSTQMTQDEKKQFIIDLETEIFNKHPEVDHYYRKKIADANENIKFLQNFKEIAEMVAIKRSIQIFRLLQPHHQFKDNITRIDKGIKEKRLLLKQQQKQLAQQQREEENQKANDDELMIPKEQQIMKAIYSNTAIDGQESEMNIDESNQKIKVQESEEDDLESLDSNPALFSDDEDIVPPQQQMLQNQYDPYQTATPIQQLPANRFPGDYHTAGYNQQVQPQFAFMTQRQYVQYNPYEVLDQRNNKYNQKKQSEPIMYDPLKDKLKNQQNRQKNVAPPGSLLKVWEGLLELSKESQPSCQLFSTYDIQIFQSLPEIPSILSLKGKAKISDVQSHFLRLRKEKKLIRGWITRRGTVGNINDKNFQGTNNWQENSDKYTKLFDELENTQKAALFNVFSGVTLYLVPITSQTKEFCRQMNIMPEPINSHDKENSSLNIEASVQEETHCFAVLSQIKQTFSKQFIDLNIFSKLNFLNPEVLRLVSPERLDLKGERGQPTLKNDKSFSPITSDDEDNPKQQHSAQILQSVKTEDHGYINKGQQDLVNQRLQIKTDEDVQMREPQQQTQPMITKQEVEGQQQNEEEELDLDKIIEKFKRQELDVYSMQEKLMPIIYKINGENELKLTQFLQELISTVNNQGDQQPSQQPPIKEEVVQTPSNPQMQMYNQGLRPQQQQIQPQGPAQFNIVNPNIRFPPQQQPQPQQNFFNQQNQPQFRQMNPQQQQFQIGQQQIRPAPQPVAGQIFPPQQIPQMGLPIQQQPNMQFQQGSQFNPNQMPYMLSQPQIGVPPLRPPPVGQMNFGQNQMLRPQHGMIPQQQFGGNIPPRMMGVQQQQHQQHQYQQPRQLPPNQQQKR